MRVLLIELFSRLIHSFLLQAAFQRIKFPSCLSIGQPLGWKEVAEVTWLFMAPFDSGPEQHFTPPSFDLVFKFKSFSQQSPFEYMLYVAERPPFLFASERCNMISLNLGLASLPPSRWPSSQG